MGMLRTARPPAAANPRVRRNWIAEERQRLDEMRWAAMADPTICPSMRTAQLGGLDRLHGHLDRMERRCFMTVMEVYALRKRVRKQVDEETSARRAR
jgi:hypothetical protein